MRPLLGAFWFEPGRWRRLATRPSRRRIRAPPLLFGQSAALSGPASELGTGMRLGLMAAFDEVNRNGGVGGRPLSLISLG